MMFGHQDESTQQNDTAGDQPAARDNHFIVGDDSNKALPPNDMSFPGAPATDTPVADTDSLLEAHADDGFTGASPAPDVTTASASAPDTTQDEAPTVGSPSPLSDLKQQALQQLSPLVGQLDQTPEEKFRTTMMLIQASDNQDLLPTAYEAANQITDEKAKAQALLDVINEINYFTQQQKG